MSLCESVSSRRRLYYIATKWHFNEIALACCTFKDRKWGNCFMQNSLNISFLAWTKEVYSSVSMRIPHLPHHYTWVELHSCCMCCFIYRGCDDTVQLWAAILKKEGLHNFTVRFYWKQKVLKKKKVCVLSSKMWEWKFDMYINLYSIYLVND